ncbi:MAG TPA: 6-phosphofructokinase [Tepidisphaeraceae bacterium]|nr:6-phosphofructokinase [Tepidisphaeraceae bacterium]
MPNAPRGNAVIGQSGGPTAVINQSLVGAVLEARQQPHIARLLGARHGVRGIINNDFLDLGKAPEELLERVAVTPASALGSTRDKPDAAYCDKIFASFRQNDVRYFFYIGGNDSADTARIVSELAKQANYDLQVFHIPKTIDNDLRVHDHTPGYGSAAKFVATAMIGDNYDNASLPGIKVDIIMGRHAGFLTAASVLARRHPEDGPHLIYVPEAPITEEQFLADVDRVYSKQKRCLIAVSEGIAFPDGKTWAEHVSASQERDSHGNLQLSGTGALGDYLGDLIKKKLTPPGGKALRVRADTFGYLQRSFPGCVSEADAREAREVGRLAVRHSAQAGATGSVAMRRKAGSSYEIEYFLTPLNTVARETKHMDPAYVQNGNNITQAFIDYATPLVGKLPVVGAFDEMR